MDITKGTETRITLTVKDIDGVLTDVDTIDLTIKNVTDVTVLPTISAAHPSVGVYVFSYTPTLSGRHDYRAETTNPDVVYEGTFYVKSSSFE